MQKMNNEKKRIYEIEIEIEEILQSVHEVEATSITEAIDIIQEQYSNEEIILEPEFIKETNFRHYDPDKYIDSPLNREYLLDKLIEYMSMLKKDDELIMFYSNICKLNNKEIASISEIDINYIDEVLKENDEDMEQ